MFGSNLSSGRLPCAPKLETGFRRLNKTLAPRLKLTALSYEDQGTGPISGSANKKKGTVKWFDSRKGYGFISPVEGGEDVFVHQTDILAAGYRALKEGESVEFDLEDVEGGRQRAVEVTGPDGKDPQGSMMDDPYLSGSATSSSARYSTAPYTRKSGLSSGLQLVVHNLPWAVSSERLLETFADFGAIDAQIQYDEMGRSRGYGIVKFNEEEDAKKAVEELHMTEVEGRNITVRFDRYG